MSGRKLKKITFLFRFFFFFLSFAYFLYAFNFYADKNIIMTLRQEKWNDVVQ